MPDLPDYSQSVSVDAASVTLTVSGAVSISSGSVTIDNASIAVINATGTKITSARPPRRAIFVADSPNPNTQNFVLDSDVQAIVLELPQSLASYVHVKVAWHPVSGGALGWVPLELFEFTQNVYVIPITPDTFDTQGNVTNSLDITIQGISLNGQSVVGHYLYESAPMWLEFFAPSFAEPNQFPKHVELGLAAGVAQWIITPVANVRITVFDIIAMYYTNGAVGDQWYIGHSAALPGVAPPAPGTVLATGGDLGIIPFVYPMRGSQLGRGEGIWAIETLSAAANFGISTTYSLD